MIAVNGVVLLRRDTEANWAYVNPMIADGEAALSTDKKDFKVGPGLWADLSYWIESIGSNVVQKSFTAQTGLTINWQTDLADGVHTYAALLGNFFPRPVVALLSSGSDYVYPGTLPVVNYSAGLVNTVTFDWGVSSDGYIRF